MAATLPISSAMRRLAFALTVAAATVAATTRAEAQFVAVIVNGDPVTTFDIEQRSKLTQLATHKTPSRQEVVEDLINEKLKLQLVRRYNIPDIDKDVNNAFANMARRTRQTPKEFSDQLAKAGIKSETLKTRIRADLIWSQIIRSRYQSSFQFSDKDIQARLDVKKPENAETVGYDYTLRPILFVVPRGSPPAAFDARKKEAESLRGRFDNCEQGLAMARAIKFVAVRASVVKGSADLAPALREILAKTEVGHLTPPETTRDGIEIFAVCSKRQSDYAPAKKEIRDQMYQEAFNSHAARYLKELRSQAMIEYR